MTDQTPPKISKAISITVDDYDIIYSCKTDSFYLVIHRQEGTYIYLGETEIELFKDCYVRP